MIQKISRRSLLAGAVAMGAFAMIEGIAKAAATKPFFQWIGLPIGLQVYTLGDEAGRDLDATFAQIAAIGYREIELPSLYDRKPAEVHAAAHKAGLTIASFHIPPVTGAGVGLNIASPPAELADALGALGASRG